MSKVKVLLVGPVQGNIETLVDKLKNLQSSKAGPFDVCFCVGPFFGPDYTEEETYRLQTLLDGLPLPVYLQNYAPRSVPGLLLEDEAASNDTSITTEGGIVQLTKSLWHLRGATKSSSSANIWNISIPNHQTKQNIVVASCPKHVRIEADACKPLLDKSKTVYQSGCDLFLTEEWPQGMEDVLQVDQDVCFDTSQIALACKPRYHIAASLGAGFQASPAYQIPGTLHHARFIALAPVVAGKTTKSTKYIHALGLVPLEDNPPFPLPTTPALPCPFVLNSCHSHHPRPIPPPPPPPPQGSAFSRFDTGRKRQRKDDDGDGRSIYDLPEDPSVSSLFLYGLHKDVSGELQSTSSPIILQTFQKYNVQHVRHPPSASTSTYCFLEFPSQQDALACLLDCQAQCTIKGVELTLKWATGQKRSKPSPSQPPPPPRERHFVTRAEAPQSTTLYFHPPKDHDSLEESFAEDVRKLMEQTLEDSMNADCNSEEERITAKSEPALAVSVRAREKYGFLQFASSAAATMALAALTKSTDGGTIENKDGTLLKPPQTHLAGTVVRWAKGETPKPKRTKEADYLEALGLERKHFPADSRTDCWFCLASPTCEKHLITSVYDSCYTTMPKGPMHPGHILIVPVAHSSQGIWTLGGQAGEEFLQIKDKLQRHASMVYEMDLFVFERAIQTRGGYHTHMQCVPVPRGLITKLQSTMMAHAKGSGFDLRPVQSDLGMASLLNEGGQDEDYFYAELATEQTAHRFLFKANGNGESVPKVPLQFGREVVASVLNQPKLAHWKSCIVDKDKETELATDFRQSLASFEGNS
jgi:Protein similar to CwfJ C-terminus 1